MFDTKIQSKSNMVGKKFLIEILINLSIYILIKLCVALLDCLRPCVDSIIQVFGRPVMKVSNLDTIEFIFNFILFNFILFILYLFIL